MRHLIAVTLLVGGLCGCRPAAPRTASPAQQSGSRQRPEEAQRDSTRGGGGRFILIDPTRARRVFRPPPVHDTDPRLMKLIGGAC